MNDYECPICGKDQNEGFCEHFVATLCDDGDGFDVEMPIYFGWDSVSVDHDRMTDSIFKYLLRLKELFIAVAEAGHHANTKVRARCAELPSDESRIVLSSLKVLDAFRDNPGYEHEDVVWELNETCKHAFNAFYIKANGKSQEEHYEIAHSPGLSWSGTNYWSADGKICSQKIAALSAEAMERLGPLIALARRSA
jgi:hypothetical protein